MLSPANNSGTVIGPSPLNIHSITLPTGIWIIFGTANTNAYAGTYFYISISAASNLTDANCAVISRFVGTVSANLSVSRVVVVTAASQTWYFVGQVDTAVATSGVSFNAVRVG